VNLQKLFKVLVLGGSALSLAHCGGNMEPSSGATQQLPDGGTVSTGAPPGLGGSGGGGGGSGGGSGGGGGAPMGW
jgi:hypothetical protein